MVIGTAALGLAGLASCSGSSGSLAVLGDILNQSGLLRGGSASLDQGTIAAGLKEALRIGIRNTIIQTSQTDGFLGNDLIRIPEWRSNP